MLGLGLLKQVKKRAVFGAVSQIWRQKKAMLAKMKREGEPTDSARICEVNYTVHSSETEKH